MIRELIEGGHVICGVKREISHQLGVRDVLYIHTEGFSIRMSRCGTFEFEQVLESVHYTKSL